MALRLLRSLQPAPLPSPPLLAVIREALLSPVELQTLLQPDFNELITQMLNHEAPQEFQVHSRGRFVLRSYDDTYSDPFCLSWWTRLRTREHSPRTPFCTLTVFVCFTPPSQNFPTPRLGPILRSQCSTPQTFYR